MYLKRLEIQGFKSFADHFTVEFGSGMTAVVGPNGCGKSNLTEALQWVLGEQNARNLRGYKMEDVIFSGTSKRRSLGMCAVSLTFDNSSQLLPLPYEEVTIARRVYRSGEGEYFINKTPCRLRDIQELFASCGIGRAAFSIIPQGRIDEFLSVRPEERRYYLEEAAGVSKYRQRKEEALRKLAETEQSLLRIRDLLGELERQRAPLAEQARIADIYHQYDHQLRVLELRLLEGELSQSRDKQERLKGSTLVMQQKVQRYGGLATFLDQDVRILTGALDELRQRVHLMETEAASLQSEKGELELAQARSEEQSRSYSLRDVELDDRLQHSRLQEERIAARLETVAGEYHRYSEKREQVSLLFAQLTEKKLACTAEKARCEQDYESYNSQLFGMVHQKTVLASRIRELENKRELLLNQKANLKLREERSQERLQQLLQQRQELEQELSGAVGRLQVIREQVTQEREVLQQLAKDREEITRLLRQLLQQVTVAETRLGILKEAEEHQEGYQKGVREVLRARSHGNPDCAGIVGVVEDLFTIDQRFETALTVAMGRSSQNLVCPNPEQAQRAIHYLRSQGSGRASFLPMTAVDRWAEKERLYHEQTGREVLGRLSELVSCEEQYRLIAEFLLGRTYVTADLKGAKAFAERNYYRVRVVTLEGDLVQPGGLITGGRVSEQVAQPTRRKQELVRLSEKINCDRQQVADLKEQDEQLAQQQHQSETRLQKLEGTLQQEQNRREQQLAVLKQEAQQLSEFNRNFLLDGEAQGDHSADLETEITSLQQELAVTMEREQQLDSSRQQAEEQRKATEASAQELDGRLSDTRVTLSSLNQEQKHLATEQEQLQRADEARNKDREQLQASINRLGQEIAAGEQQSVGTRARLQELARDQSGAIKQLSFYQRQCQVKERYLQARERRARKVKEIAWQGEQRLHNLDLQSTHLQQELAGIEERAGELGFTLQPDQLLRNLSRSEEAEVRGKITKLKGELVSIGEVNFAAPAAYRDLQERYDFITEQQGDLDDGKQQLGVVISEMDRNVSSRFLGTYREVREHFAAIFSELCDGGEADLLLTDQDNPLSTGLDMVVTPKGKRPRHLSLLSGGERSLTGIAFLFALLRTRPSPFYLLDEIEAFLDEANLARFAGFLKRMGESSQLILITHRYPTMEVADALYGITMEEPGVSKLVSVKLTGQGSVPTEVGQIS